MTTLNCNPLISIIIPIYNTELYLSNCLSSISAQSYRNIEILLINDGSTDSSKLIAERYAATESRAKFISQPNAGVAAARNTGLINASGDLIIHADSDDILPSDAIETLYKSMEENNSDIAIGDYIVRYPNKDILVSPGLPGDQEAFLAGLLKGTYHASLWNKLIKRSLYDGLQFDAGLDYMEDMLILAKIFLNHNIKISYINKAIYIYRQRAGSYTNSLSQKSLETKGIIINKLCTMFEARYGFDFFVSIKNKHRLQTLMRDPTFENTDKADWSILNDREISLKHKILLWLILRNITSPLRLYRLIQSFFRVNA